MKDEVDVRRSESPTINKVGSNSTPSSPPIHLCSGLYNSAHSGEGSYANMESETSPKRRRGPRKRQRIVMSCIECRRRKLGCDRQQPCQRCIESRTPQLCRFDVRSRTSQDDTPTAARVIADDIPLTSPVSLDVQSAPGPAPESERSCITADISSRLQSLEQQNAEFRRMLLLNERTASATDASGSAAPDPSPVLQPAPKQGDRLRRFVANDDRARSVTHHGARSAFNELLHNSPAVTDGRKDWLNQLATHPPNLDRAKRRQQNEDTLSRPALELEALLPGKEATGALVMWYLGECEPFYHIVHRPSFLEQYASFWEAPRQGVFTMMVLAMVSMAHCLGRNHDNLTSASGTSIASITADTRLGWVAACEQWLAQHGDKFYRLAHLQAACLVQMARRVNRFHLEDCWLHASRITRGAISVGLHREQTSQITSSRPFQDEMRRRMWTTVALIDVHACFNQGMPTLLSNLQVQARHPGNVEDAGFDTDSTPDQMPSSHPEDVFTSNSFQIQSIKSMDLRLELMCYVSKTQHSKPDHETALQYTDKIIEAIVSLPIWDEDASDRSNHAAGKAGEARVLLEIELRQFIMPLHQPFLSPGRNDTRSQFSAFLYFAAIRDMIRLQEKALSIGGHVVGAMHDDALRYGLGLTRLVLVGQSSVADPSQILVLMRKCVYLEEVRSIQCGSNEGSHFAVLSAMVAFFETFFGHKTAEDAKADHRVAQAAFEERLGGPHQNRTDSVDKNHPQLRTETFMRTAQLNSATINDQQSHLAEVLLDQGTGVDMFFSDFALEWESSNNVLVHQDSGTSDWLGIEGTDTVWELPRT